jgi:hypothetical protein
MGAQRPTHPNIAANSEALASCWPVSKMLLGAQRKLDHPFEEFALKPSEHSGLAAQAGWEFRV